MRLSLASKLFVIRNLPQFIIFSLSCDKNYRIKAKAEGLTFEEYIKKYFTLDNSNGEYSKQLSFNKE